MGVDIRILFFSHREISDRFPQPTKWRQAEVYYDRNSERLQSREYNLTLLTNCESQYDLAQPSCLLVR